MSFSKFYLLKELGEIKKDHLIVESSDNLSLKSIKGLESELISYFSKKYPNAQFKDLEDAFFTAVIECKGKKFQDEKSAKVFLKKIINKEIKNIYDNKRKYKKELSCVKTIRNSLGKDLGNKISSLINRADKILTSQEKKILSMCTQGKSVRQIGLELKVSAPSAWRVLNSAIDKIRLSHGLRSRYKDVRR